MTLDKLKTAWQLYQLESTLPGMGREEILSAIEVCPSLPWYKNMGLLINSGVFVFLLLCCQGG